MNLKESFQTDQTSPRMSAAKWLDYRKQVAPRVQIPIKYPEQVCLFYSTEVSNSVKENSLLMELVIVSNSRDPIRFVYYLPFSFSLRTGN